MIPIFVINLNRDPDRLACMLREFERVGLTFERLPGIYGTDLPPALYPYFCDSEGALASPLRRGEIGCYASHLTAWRNIVSRDLAPGALICEDDIILPDDMPDLVDSLIEAAPSGWDIIRLSSRNKKAVSVVAELHGGYRLVRCWKISVNAGSYLISRTGAEKMLRPVLRQNPIDVDISRPWLFGMNTYGVVPRPIIQNNILDKSVSTIDKIDNRAITRAKRTKLQRLLRKIGKIPTRIRHAVYNLETMGAASFLICLFQNFEHKITGRKFEWSKKTG